MKNIPGWTLTLILGFFLLGLSYCSANHVNDATPFILSPIKMWMILFSMVTFIASLAAFVFTVENFKNRND